MKGVTPARLAAAALHAECGGARSCFSTSAVTDTKESTEC